MHIIKYTYVPLIINAAVISWICYISSIFILNSKLVELTNINVCDAAGGKRGTFSLAHGGAHVAPLLWVTIEGFLSSIQSTDASCHCGHCPALLQEVLSQKQRDGLSSKGDFGYLCLFSVQSIFLLISNFFTVIHNPKSFIWKSSYFRLKNLMSLFLNLWRILRGTGKRHLT